MTRRTPLVVVTTLAIGLLTGCTTAQPGAATTVPPASTPRRPTATTTSATITPAATPTRSESTVTTASVIPAGASTRRVPDLDGDGVRDTEFLTTSAPYVYGVRLSGGGTVTTPDPLPAGGTHRAWIVATDGPTGRTVVLDDGRSATLYSFRDGRFVRPTGVDGGPFEVAIGTSVPGSTTGVNCNDQNGGILIEVARTVQRSDGKVDVRWSNLGFVDQDGKAELDAPTARWKGLAPDDARVRHAETSYCWAARETVSVAR